METLTLTKTLSLNILIVDDNKSMINLLESALKEKFGEQINIAFYDNVEEYLRKVKGSSELIVLDYLDSKEKGKNIVSRIKAGNPAIDVLRITTSADIESVVKALFSKYSLSFQPSETELLAKPVGNEKVKKNIWEFGVKKYLVVFLISFLVMVALYLILDLANK